MVILEVKDRVAGLQVAIDRLEKSLFVRRDMDSIEGWANNCFCLLAPWMSIADRSIEISIS
jgi:hypothetical protein